METTAQEKKRIIYTKDLCKSFTTGNVEQQVLKSLDLEIYQGDFTVIMGNSGSGKSTLLYALSGMDRPSMGAITYEPSGQEPTGITMFSNDQLAKFRRDHVGFVFQQNYLNDSMSALDNVMVVGLLKQNNRKELAAKAKELLQRVEIEEGAVVRNCVLMQNTKVLSGAVLENVISDKDVVVTSNQSLKSTSNYPLYLKKRTIV